ncbi:MAG TPA: spore cortex biosynthesis protein YabQ [Sedimentibacter sp.]|nr:spore cortex biosynthesis protein YabQ [Sedimentibacter sp.]
MDYLPYSQEYMLAVSIMAGMFLGFIWDIYRLIRHYGKFKTTGTVIGDILYWIVSITISTRLILDISYGNVRFFILMGFVAGALLYFYGISSYVLKLFIFIIDSIIKVIKTVIHLLIDPIKFIIRKIKIFLYPLKLKYNKVEEKLKKRYKFLKFKLKKVFKNKKMIYNRKKRKRQLKKRKKRRLSPGA